MLQARDYEIILRDVLLKVSAPAGDGAEKIAAREAIQKEVDDILAADGTVDIPPEIPDIS